MAIISEYEQLSTQPKDLPSDVSEGEKSLLKKLDELLTRMKRHRKRYDTDWRYNYEFVCAGKQWPVERPRWRFTEVTNFIWADIGADFLDVLQQIQTVAVGQDQIQQDHL